MRLIFHEAQQPENIDHLYAAFGDDCGDFDAMAESHRNLLRRVRRGIPLSDDIIPLDPGFDDASCIIPLGPDLDDASADFGDALASLDGGFSLLHHTAKTIRDRVAAICGHRVEYDEQNDREYRLSQKQTFMPPLVASLGLRMALPLLLLGGILIWSGLDLHREIAQWETAVPAKGVITGFTDDSRPPAVRYAYSDRDGQKYSGSMPRGFAPDNAAIGDEIDLFYLPADPEQSKLVLPDWDGLFHLAAVMAVFLLFAGIMAACLYFGVMPAWVNGRPVLVGKDELAEDYFFR